MSDTSARVDRYVTSMKSNEYVFTWVMENFDIWHTNVKNPQYSATFPAGQDEMVQWRLFFYVRAVKDTACCALFVELVEFTPSPEIRRNFMASYDFKLADSDGNTIVQNSFKHILEKNETRGYDAMIDRRIILEKIKPANKLCITCKIVTFHETVPGTVTESPVQPRGSEPSSFSQDFETIFDGKKFSDVTLVIGKQRISAHKNILAARSPVFDAMFTHPMKEKKTNRVTITDAEPEVFEELLRFMYTDKVASLEAMAIKLYEVADKYAVVTLKNLCRRHILDQLDWQTAADTLVLANMHSDEAMKKEALKFISGSEGGKVTKSEGWRKMVQFHPHLVDETVEALVAKTAGFKEG